MADGDIEEGDTVTVGVDGKIHWIVESLYTLDGLDFAHLRSGMTGRHKYRVDIDDLHLFKKTSRS